VVVVQCFGGALNLNIHLHALVLDGVFTHEDGAVRFHPVPRLTRDDVAEVVALVARWVTRLVERRGLAGRAENGETSGPWSEEAPVLAAVATASVDGRVAMGPRAGARVTRPRFVCCRRRSPRWRTHGTEGQRHLHLRTTARRRNRLSRLS
jgi:putative transposase